MAWKSVSLEHQSQSLLLCSIISMLQWTLKNPAILGLTVSMLKGTLNIVRELLHVVVVGC